MLRNRLPIQTSEQLWGLWEEFKEHMKEKMTGDPSGPIHPEKFRPDSTRHRVKGAELFVEFLCGKPLKKR